MRGSGAPGGVNRAICSDIFAYAITSETGRRRHLTVAPLRAAARLATLAPDRQGFALSIHLVLNTRETIEVETALWAEPGACCYEMSGRVSCMDVRLDTPSYHADNFGHDVRHSWSGNLKSR